MPGVYISYPFCRQKCTYCNFASGVATAGMERDYVAALLDEISGNTWQWMPETLYLGGGSPARMSEEAFSDVLRAVPGRPWKEATIEVSPGEVTPEKARLWRERGITRVSLGVQSFVPEEIVRTGRKHTPETVAEDVARLRRAEIHTLNIDLIAGLPSQTAAGWDTSLAWIQRLGVGHVSVYMLEVDDKSRLGRELLDGGDRYGAGDVPGEDRIIEFYETAVERLARLGLDRYEISNFARPGEESLHNVKYWRLEPYVGFGADAHSFDGTTRRANATTAADYIRRMRSRGAAVVEEAPAKLAEERFFVGLRLSEGMIPTEEEWRRFAGPISRFLAEGLLRRESGRLRLTDRGVLLSNEVFEEFVRI